MRRITEHEKEPPYDAILLVFRGIGSPRPLNREALHRLHLQIHFSPIALHVVIMHELPQDKALEFIKTKKYGNLALCGRNQPYCIPIAYTHTDTALLLYQSSRGRALEYLEENQRACFEIHDIDGFRDWKSVIIEGWISRVTDPAELRDALRMIEKNINLIEGSYEDAARAITSGKAGGVYKVIIERLSAVQS